MAQRVITFKIGEGLLEALDDYARRKRMSRSEVIREALYRLLRSEGYEVPRRPERPDPRAVVFEVEV